MNSNSIIKNIYITLIMFTILGLFSLIPLSKYKKNFDAQRKKYHDAPQIHINATERYVEAIEEGLEDTQKGIQGRAPKKYYLQVFNNKTNENKKIKAKESIKVRVKKTKPEKQYKKPRYVRDKNNPNILKPYKNTFFIFQF